MLLLVAKDPEQHLLGLHTESRSHSQFVCEVIRELVLLSSLLIVENLNKSIFRMDKWGMREEENRRTV